jgi:hypothetical protein
VPLACEVGMTQLIIECPVPYALSAGANSYSVAELFIPYQTRWGALPSCRAGLQVMVGWKDLAGVK